MRGKTRVSMSWLGLVLHVIGWEVSTFIPIIERLQMTANTHLKISLSRISLEMFLFIFKCFFFRKFLQHWELEENKCLLAVCANQGIVNIYFLWEKAKLLKKLFFVLYQESWRYQSPIANSAFSTSFCSEIEEWFCL